MKRWIVVGLDGSGKTSICNLIEKKEESRKYKNDLIYRDKTLEIPGSYIENRWLNNIIIMLVQNQGKGVIFLYDGETLDFKYPPYFASTFTKPTIGIISKSDIISSTNRRKASKKMIEMGCNKIIFLSIKNKEGVHELIKWLNEVEVSERGNK